MKDDLVTHRGICGICPAGCWVEVDLRDGRLETIKPRRVPPPRDDLSPRPGTPPKSSHSENRLRPPDATHRTEGDLRVRAHLLGRGVRSHRRPTEPHQKGIGPRGGVGLHRPRSVRIVAVRHVPAARRGGLLRIERAVPVRLPQHHGSRRAVLRLVRDDGAAPHPGAHAGRHVHRHGERRSAGGVGRQSGDRFTAARHAPTGGGGAARRRDRRHRPAPDRYGAPHRRRMDPDPARHRRRSGALPDCGDDRGGPARRGVRRQLVPRLRRAAVVRPALFPEVAAAITGVPAATIRRLARTLCRATGACPSCTPAWSTPTPACRRSGRC